MACLNSSRSSAFSIAWRSAPINFTAYFESTPASSSASAKLSAVCPPRVGKSASGRSRAMTRSMLWTVNGST